MRNGQVVCLFGEVARTAQVLGGKGAGLAEMVHLGVPVPPGFTVTTTVARAFGEHGGFPARFAGQLERGVKALEARTGKRFGGNSSPLLVSVRSGAAKSMPGMMDTVLNLGLNPKTVKGLAKDTGSKRFALDTYRRFLSLFGDVVLGIDRGRFEKILVSVKHKQGVNEDSKLTIKSLEGLCEKYRELISIETKRPVPDDAWQQLEMAITAVFLSWDSERAKAYRQAHKIPEWWGTAVNVQAMVFGNRGNDSGTGVVFSRDVSTGNPELYGEFLVNAQGEDVVAGIRTPLPIAKMKEWNPHLFTELQQIVRKLEAHLKDAVDVEFTVENGRLYILQYRAAKRTPEAAVTIATHFVWEGLLTKDEALQRVTAEQTEAVSRQVFKPEALARAAQAKLLAKGLPASPGAAVGTVALSSAEAIKLANNGVKVILVRDETSPSDLPGLLVSAAVVTKVGGATSHAAVVARSLGKPAVVGVQDLLVKEGQTVSVDGATGMVMNGVVEMANPVPKKEINIFLRWMEKSNLHWPKPRFDPAYIEEVVSVNTTLNDFYLVDAMTQASKGTELESAAASLRRRIHIETAERFVAYLAMAVGAESRHYHPQEKDSIYNDESKVTPTSPAYFILRAKYHLPNDYWGPSPSDRENTQRILKEALKKMDPAEAIEFFRLNAEAFEKGTWRSAGFGGPKWAVIATTGLLFLSGKLNHSAFADHVFDLQHNSGNVFDKHQMLSGDRGEVQMQLEIKKSATSVVSLHDDLARWEFGAEVENLFQRGKDLGLWKTGISQKAA